MPLRCLVFLTDIGDAADSERPNMDPAWRSGRFDISKVLIGIIIVKNVEKENFDIIRGQSRRPLHPWMWPDEQRAGFNQRRD